MEVARNGEVETAGLLIRRAGPADARAIAEVTVAGWQSAYRGILPDDFLDSMRVDAREIAWRSMLENDPDGGTPAWVAELAGGGAGSGEGGSGKGGAGSGGRVVGFIGSGPPRDGDVPLPAAEIYAIYVLPRFWRHGLGRALMNTAAEHWNARATRVRVLWVFEANDRARAFYQRLGWHPDGGRQEFAIGGVSAIEIRYRFEYRREERTARHGPRMPPCPPTAGPGGDLVGGARSWPQPPQRVGSNV